MYSVDADKGFNYSLPDEAFICQKKNHFQITIRLCVTAIPRFARSADDNSTVETMGFYLQFHGIKTESPNQVIKIEQSQTDRSKIPYTPVRVEPVVGSEVKFTVCRLHFSETTSNNMRKKGRPNPDQRFFQLVVSLVARCRGNTGKNGDLSHRISTPGARHASHDFVERVVAAQISEPIIVRASNPGQFDNEPEAPWSKGISSDCVYHMGTVGINTEAADEALTVHGNVRVTGHVLSPSDTRIKTDVEEVDTREQLNNIARLRLVKFNYREQYADSVGMSETQRKDTGVLAQEVEQILPEAVIETGDIVLNNGETIPNLMVVNKERIFIENVGAVKELCKVTDNLESRINLIEALNKKVASMQRTSSGRSACSAKSSESLKLRSEKAESLAGQQKEKSHHRSSQQGSVTNGTPVGATSSSAVAGATEKKGLCNSRLVQVVIVILVAIMAAW